MISAALTGGTAVFQKTDTTTGGTWSGIYGAEGYTVIGDKAVTPPYVTMTASANSGWVWANPTTDTRALQEPSALSSRVAACWYSGSAFSVDLNFTDQKTHQVAFYALDWDNYYGRNERIDILDFSSNAVVDTRNVSGFYGGQYLVWNLSGHVVVRFTNLNSLSNAVLSGIFFGTASSSSTAAFVKTDASTAGTWKSAYGGDGFTVVGDTANYPSYVTVTPAGNASWVWASSTADGRALQKAASTTDRVAACWYSGSSFSVELNFQDSNTHQVAFYALDWDNYYGRNERIDILDFNTNAVLDTRNVTGFVGGEYLVWNLSGHVIVRFTNLNSLSNAVLSGIFFGGASSAAANTATFLNTDSSTEGSWKGVYGADGYNIVDGDASYPSYVSPAATGNAFWLWASSSSDMRALQKAGSATDRIAACWYTSGTMSMDLAFRDSVAHQIALYMLDWDRLGRSERIDILDGDTNALLDTRSLSSFAGGQYLVWKLGGHVVVRITNLNNVNAVVSGLFFR